MPLRHIHRFRGGSAALWEICEENSFFEKQLLLSEEEQATYRSLPFGKRPPERKRRTQWLAARHLLQLLDGSEPRRSLLHRPSGQPFFAHGKGHCSLSHSGKYAAAATASMPVGIDIQKTEDRILRLSAKFITPEERLRWEGHPRQREIFTLYWTAKEALFKAAGLQGVDFKRDLRIRLPEFRDGGQLLAEIYRPARQNLQDKATYQLHSTWNLRYRLFEDCVYSIATPQNLKY